MWAKLKGFFRELFPFRAVPVETQQAYAAERTTTIVGSIQTFANAYLVICFIRFVSLLWAGATWRVVFMIFAAAVCISGTQHVLAEVSRRILLRLEGRLNGTPLSINILGFMTASTILIAFVVTKAYTNDALKVYSIHQVNTLFVCGLVLMISDLRVHLVLMGVLQTCELLMPYNTVAVSSIFASSLTANGIFLLLIFIHERDQRNNYILKQQVKRGKQMYKDFMNKLNIPVVMYTEQGVLHCNEAAQRLGVTQDSFHAVAQQLKAADGSSLDPLLTSILQDTTIQIVNREFVMGEGDRMRTFLVTAWATRSESITAAVTLNDITDTVLLQEQKAAEKYTNMLLYSLSHELRTPLNGIKGILKHIIKNYNGLRPSLRKNLVRAKASCVRLANEINDILDYVQLTTNEFSVHSQEFSLPQLLNKLKQHTILELGERTRCIRVGTELSPGVPTRIIADLVRLKQACLNLLSNAIKYTAKGEILIAATYEEPTQMLTLAVTDTGCGMSAEQIDKLFAIKMTQGRERENRLAGLGLTVTQMICQRLEGRLEVRSELGRGSTFALQVRVRQSNALGSLTAEEEVGDGAEERGELSSRLVIYPGLVRHESGASEGCCPSHPAALPGDSLVLVVDDTELNQFVLCELVKRHSIEVRTAANGDEAVQLVQAELLARPNVEILIFMDLEMPVMDGLTAGREIRALPALHPPILVAATAFAAERERNACTEAGFNLFITKPVSASDVKKALSLLRGLVLRS